MAAILKFLCYIFLCTLFVQGNSQPCSAENLKIKQVPQIEDHKRVWNVTISNDCICAELNVKLSCDGFQTKQAIDPSILAKNGSECTVNGGQPIYGFGSFSFVYDWPAQFRFKGISAQAACS